MLARILLIVQVAIGPYLAPDGNDDTDFDEEEGLLVRSLPAPDGGTIDYERPVVLLPASMTEGELHTSQRRFVLRVDGERQDVGAHYFESELIGSDSLPGYEDCLKIRRHAIRMDFSGTQQGYDVTEWYARGKGLVKVEGERFWKDADGNVTRTEGVFE